MQKFELCATIILASNIALITLTGKLRVFDVVFYFKEKIFYVKLFTCSSEKFPRRGSLPAHFTGVMVVKAKPQLPVHIFQNKIFISM